MSHDSGVCPYLSGGLRFDLTREGDAAFDLAGIEFRSRYSAQREVDLATLTDPRIVDAFSAMEIRLIDFDEARA